MSFYKDFEQNLAWVKQRIEEDIKEFPPGLRKLASVYLKSRGLRPEDPPVTGISAYMPYWLADAFRFEDKEHTCELLSTGSIYVTLSFELQDSIVDDPKADPATIWLSDAFLLRYFSVLQSLFSHQSGFWKIQEDCLKESYQAQILEKRCLSPEFDPLSEPVLGIIRKQTSFLKPTAAAVALLGGRQDRIEKLFRMLEDFHVGIKLVDDVVDWEDDLRNGTYTTFLCGASRWLKKQRIEELTEEDVNTFILESNGSIELLDGAISHAEFAREDIADMECPYMKEFLSSTCRSYVGIKERMGDRQRLLRQGSKSITRLLGETCSRSGGHQRGEGLENHNS